MSVTVYGKLKIFAGKQFIRLFFSVVLMNKNVYESAIRRRDSPSESDSANSVTI